MHRSSLRPLPVLLLALACSAASSERELDNVVAEMASLRARSAAIQARMRELEHAETEILFNDAEHEFKSMAIDWAQWSDQPTRNGPMFVEHDRPPYLQCHVVEWDGFGRMKRFTALADARFDLLLDGEPIGQASMSVGGISSATGSIRFVTLHPTGRVELVAGATYSIRPRNAKPGYTWVVPASLAVARR